MQKEFDLKRNIVKIYRNLEEMFYLKDCQYKSKASSNPRI